MAEKPFVYTAIVGLASNELHVALSSSLVNVEKCLFERVYYVKDKVTGLHREPYRPNAEYLTEVFRTARTEVGKRMRRIYTPLSTDEFLAGYSGGKKAMYANACESVRNRPITRKDARLGAFIKREPYNVLRKTLKQLVPRLIQPRTPRFNAALGVYTRRIEHDVYIAIDKWFVDGPCKHPVVFKGYNMDVQGELLAAKWRSIAAPVAICFDADRFDQHISAEVLRHEHDFYKSKFGRYDRRKLGKLLDMQIDNRGRIPVGTRWINYRRTGGRCSGDMNTGLGNVYVMCSMVKLLMERLDITRYEYFNNGDDCGLIMSREDMQKFDIETVQEHFEECGFSMTIEEPVYELERIEFCQAHPVLTASGSYRMVRNPFASMSKDCLSMQPLDTPPLLKRWLHSVMECGLALAGDMPILSEYYRCFGRMCDRIPGKVGRKDERLYNRGFFRISAGMHKRVICPSEASRYSFWLAFGIPPDQQRAVELWLGNLGFTTNPHGYFHVPLAKRH